MSKIRDGWQLFWSGVGNIFIGWYVSVLSNLAAALWRLSEALQDWSSAIVTYIESH